MIYIFTSKKTVQGLNNKVDWVTIMPWNLKGQVFLAEDQVYLDISGFSPTELKKAVNLLKKRCEDFFWGIIDPKGASGDPASFFFDGAGDYIGPALIKKGLNRKRFLEAYSWALAGKNSGIAAEKNSGAEAEKRKRPKLPAGKFEGWKSVRVGVTAPFFFLFVSFSGKTNLRSQVGEKAFITIKNRLREELQQKLEEADALLWMEAEDICLFLVPPRASSGMLAVEAGLKMILGSRLASIEKLGLSFPVDFTFALHYGNTVYNTPGKTGDVVSESVNYIFHLGTKRAEPGRFTISDEVPKEVIPQGLMDLFRPAGTFEGIAISQSRNFVYK